MVVVSVGVVAKLGNLINMFARSAPNHVAWRDDCNSGAVALVCELIGHWVSKTNTTTAVLACAPPWRGTQPNLIASPSVHSSPVAVLHCGRRKGLAVSQQP